MLYVNQSRRDPSLILVLKFDKALTALAMYTGDVSDNVACRRTETFWFSVS
jgi:hypothetical protein